MPRKGAAGRAGHGAEAGGARAACGLRRPAPALLTVGTRPTRRRPALTALAAAVAAVVALVACGPGTTARGAPTTATVGVLRAVRSSEPENLAVFVSTLEAGGFTVGKNLRLLGADPGEVHPDPEEAEATVRRWADGGLDLVVALSSTGALAAARGAPSATVLFLSNDPRAVGLLTDERRPEGRMTGLSFRVPADRTLDLARRALPGLTKLGFLYPSSDPAAIPSRDAAIRAAGALGLELTLGPFAGPEEIPQAVELLRAQGIGCLILANAPSTVRAFPAITAALADRPLPVVANTSTDIALVVLEPDTAELYRQMGRQAVRLLLGTPVSAVPVEDPAHFRFVLNTGAAAKLGLEVPTEVVGVADVVIAD